MSLAIETERLRYQPGKRFALQDLALRVPAGAVYGFLGPNGSGKTTTIKLLLGLLRARRGSIRVLGRDVPRESASVLAEVGYVPEVPHLYQSLRVDQAVDYHAGFYPGWDAALADTLLERFCLPTDQRLRTLSKGELRKLMILLAIAQRPRLLMLDEPTDGLDPVVRRDILDVLQDAVRSDETTVFISSHLVHELELICDWIAVLDDGALIAQLPMTEFRNEIKVLHLSAAPPEPTDAPFTVLRRSTPDEPPSDESVQWVVRGWRAGMESFFEGSGTVIQKIVDVDLENGFVELLRSFRNREVAG